MAAAELGSCIDSAGVPRPVAGVVILTPTGELPEVDEDGLTPYQAQVIALLTEIRDNTAPV